MKRRTLLVVLAVVVIIVCYSGTALALGNKVEHHGDSKYSYTSGDYCVQRYDNHLDCNDGGKDGHYVRCLATVDGAKVSTTDEIFDVGVELYVNDFPAYGRQVHIKIVNYDLGVGFTIHTDGYWDLTA